MINDPLKAAHLSAAKRHLAAAEADLKAAGEMTAYMRIGAILRGLR